MSLCLKLNYCSDSYASAQHVLQSVCLLCNTPEKLNTCQSSKHFQNERNYLLKTANKHSRESQRLVYRRGLRAVAHAA